MKNLSLLKRIILLVILFSTALPTFSQSYILTDNDVSVENGFIIECGYDYENTDIIIPETLDNQSIIGINPYIFKNKPITSVVLPSTLEHISEQAFYNSNLSEVDFSACFSLIYIGESAFQSNQITSLDLSNCMQIVDIYPYAFRGNSISNLNFTNCSLLRGIGPYAFYENSISQIDFTGCNSLRVINFCAFQHNSITELDLSPLTLLYRIDQYAFADNLITDINFNGCSSLENINSNAFSGNKISNLSFPNCQELKYLAWDSFANNEITNVDFSGCESIIKIDGFSNNQITVVNFNNCSSLEEFAQNAFLNNSLTHLSFPGCSSLRLIGTSAFAGNQIDTLDFSNCSSLNSIGYEAFRDNAIGFINFSDCELLGTIYKDAFKNNNLTDIDFSPCTNLSLIDEEAFADNHFSNLDFSSCINLRIIETHAFAGSEIDRLDFSNCQNLTTLGEYSFSNNSIDEVIFTGCSSLQTIADYAFYENELEELDLSSTSIVHVNPFSFGNNNLKSVNFKNCSSLKYINAEAFTSNQIDDLDFSGCSSIVRLRNDCFKGNQVDTLILNDCINLKRIDPSAFQNNAIQFLDLSGCNKLEAIGNEAFSGNSIQSLNLPEGHFSIAGTAFRNNQISLQNGNASNGIVFGRNTHGVEDRTYIASYGGVSKDIDFLTEDIFYIQSEAFSGQELSSVDFLNSLQLSYIGDHAFSNNNLLNIEIISQCKLLTYIGHSAFSGNNMSNFRIPETSILNAELEYWRTYYGDTYSGGQLVPSNSYDDLFAVTNPAAIILSREQIIFEELEIGDVKKQYFYIRNHNDSPIYIDDITVPEGFSIDWSSGMISSNYYIWDELNPKLIEVTFEPQEAKEYGGYLEVMCPDAGGYKKIYLGGTAIEKTHFDVEFHVLSDSEPIEGAVISINGYDSQITNELGKTIIEDVLVGNNIPYQVTAGGHIGTNGEISITNQNIQETVYLSVDGIQENLSKSNILVYPNPNQGILQIKSKDGEPIQQISVYTLNGFLIKTIKTKKANEYKIDLMDSPNGLYFIEVYTESGTIIIKIAKNN